MQNSKAVKLNIVNRKKIESGDQKNLIILILCALALIAFLFTPPVTRVDETVQFFAPVFGFQFLILLFNGGNASGNLEGAAIDFTVPFGAVILYSCVILLLFAAVAGATIMLLKKSQNKTFGIALLVIAVFLAAVYVILLLSGGFTGTDLYSNVFPFYRLFEFSPAYIIIFLSIFACGLMQLLLNDNTIKKLKRYFPLYLLLIIPTIFIFIFNLYPMLLQFILAFKKKGEASAYLAEWIGFDNIIDMFNDPIVPQVLLNTVIISLVRLVAGLIPPVLLSIFLFEMRSEILRKIIQTIIYTPHFFSWVIIFAIAVAFLSADGIINNYMLSWGAFKTPFEFMNSEAWFIPILLITSLWKDLGWGTILYIAALGNIDASQYEAAAIDGAGPMKKLWHITLPGIMPVMVFLTIMAVGNILKGAGGEQILLFINPQTASVGEVIDTWIYRIAYKTSEYGQGAAMSLIQSALGIVMVIGCNRLSKKITGIGMW